MKIYLFCILIALTISGCSFGQTNRYSYSDKRCIIATLLNKDRATIEKIIGKPYSENFNNNQSTAAYSIKNKNIKVCKNIKQTIIVYDNKGKLLDYQVNFN